MKSLFFTLLCLTGLGLMSFTTQPNSEITKLAQSRYQVGTAAGMSAADKDQVMSIVAPYYGLNEWTTVEQAIDTEMQPAARGKWILRKKLGLLSVFEEEFIKYDDVAEHTQEIQRLDQIIARYAR